MCFRSQAEPGKVSQCSALQLVETDAGKGLCAMEMMLCVALLFIVHVTLVVPALTKTNTWRNFFFCLLLRTCEGKKPNLKHFLLQLTSFRAAVDFSVLFPKRISFDNPVPEKPSPAVSGKLTGRARVRTQNTGAWHIHAAR